MPNFQVGVVIENKPGISDPEGDTILNDLVLKGKNTHITKIRSGTILKFFITEKNAQDAKDAIVKTCDEL
ncbi:MAG: phosphoribosylglycinamide synthetase, partial [Thaumarchaeota archaeon]|nr:phosphoribosylglycinamide synthetase [Nitrososphaerota archaeon]